MWGSRKTPGRSRKRTQRDPKRREFWILQRIVGFLPVDFAEQVLDVAIFQWDMASDDGSGHELTGKIRGWVYKNR